MIEGKKILDIWMGAKVSSKKTGFPGIGIIIGMVHPRLYAIFNKTSVEDMLINNKTWTQLYPDWHKQPIIYVYYDKPRKVLTWEEAQIFDISQEEWENYPVSQYMAYVIEDLENFEE